MSSAMPPYHAWTLYAHGSAAVLADVECVEYVLHPTFTPPVRTVCEQGDPSRAFAISDEAGREFTIGITVTHRDGFTSYFEHPLTLD